MEPYKVEARGVGCPHCQHGEDYDIVDSDGNKVNITESGRGVQAWEDPNEAAYICELLNNAHAAGRASFAQQILATANMEVKADAEEKDHTQDGLPPVSSTEPATPEDDIPF